ncbi:hypothetical protein Cni_G14073 [Canna indica]|uniref:Pentatricopeptide repeat-containing protein n=1 Tax=Canna indica TaxID=4628 RepID=A0AAQ3KDB8_9LILI|nr:hypothetical protein Cni_G14073 [Canna indica]
MCNALKHKLFTLLRECRAIHHLKQIHSLFITSGLSQDASSNARILHVAALSIPGDIAYASLVFRQTKSLDASIWNTMLRGHSLRSQHDEAFAHYAQMLREGVVPDEHTYPLVLKVLSKLRGFTPDRVHAQIFKFGYCSDNFVQNALVSAYAKCGNLASAHNLFDGMSSRDPIPWTAMIHGHVEDDQASDALALFVKMRSLGVRVDEVTIVSVLKGCGLVGHVWLGRCVHAFYVVCGRVKWDVFVGSALVDMYAKCNCCDDARGLFEEMPLKNIVTWSTMIAGYVHCSRFAEALSIFHDMLVEGQKSNEVTLTSVLTSCAQIGALDQGRWIHGYVKRSKLEANSVVGTALTDMYAKCGCIDDAVLAFNDILHKNVYTWTALINGLAIHGCASECLDFFSQMRWEDDANIRMTMKARRVEKIKGSSWIEVNGILHEFFAMNESHPESKDIYETLDGVTMIIKLESYVSESVVVSS